MFVLIIYYGCGLSLYFRGSTLNLCIISLLYFINLPCQNTQYRAKGFCALKSQYQMLEATIVYFSSFDFQ